MPDAGLPPKSHLARWQEDHRALFSSGLFDHEWYLRRYPDVSASGLPPLEHYVKYGLILGRSPNADLCGEDLREISAQELLARFAPQPVPAGRFGRNSPGVGRDTHHLGDIRLSVLCITYNHQAFIRQALDSMLSQKTNFEYEILVGDDASTDGTSKIISDYAAKHRQIRPILRTKNLGANANFIDLAHRARGDYVAVCEGDDYWCDDNKLQIQFDWLERRPEYTVCFHRVRIIFDDKPGVEEFHPEECPDRPTPELLTSHNLIQTNSVVYRWRYLRRTDFSYPLQIAPGDWYIHFLHMEIGRVGYLPREMGVYRKHSSGMWASHKLLIERHKRLGNAEIAFYREAESRFGTRFRAKFREAQQLIFSRLMTYFLDANDSAALHELYIRNRDVAEFALRKLGYAVDGLPGRDHAAFWQALLGQNTVSVVITSYNHEDTIARCLDGVLCQTGFITAEIIIGDDCSTDGTAEIIRQYHERYPDRIRVLPRPANLGMLANLQDCFRQCRGRYVAICEGDDYWLSDRKLEKQVRVLQENPDAGMCFNWLLLHDVEHNTFFPHAEQTTLASGDLSFEVLADRPLTANFSCCVFRAEAIRDVPDSYYREKDAADWLFTLYIADRRKVTFLREILSVYALHAKGQWSGLSSGAKKQRIDDYKLYFAELFDRPDAPRVETMRFEIEEIGCMPRELGIANLDQPAHGETKDVPIGQVTVSGWVLTSTPCDVVVRARHGTRQQESALTLARSDVLQFVLGITDADAEITRCGFSFEAPTDCGPDIVLDLVLDGQPVSWLRIQLLRAE